MLAHGREVHGAKNNERHVCGRPRDVSGPCLVSAQCVLKPVSRQRLTHRAATREATLYKDVDRLRANLPLAAV